MSTKAEVRRCPVCKGAPGHPQDTAIQGSPSLCRESFHAPSQRQPSPDWIAKAATEATAEIAYRLGPNAPGSPEDVDIKAIIQAAIERNAKP